MLTKLLNEFVAMRIPSFDVVPFVKIVLFEILLEFTLTKLIPNPAEPDSLPSIMMQFRTVTLLRLEARIPGWLSEPFKPYVIVKPAQSSTILSALKVTQVPLEETLSIRVVFTVILNGQTGDSCAA